jgi:FkbM family methyltransferase
MLIPFRYMPASLIKGIIHVGAHEAEELPDYLQAGIDQVAWIEANPAKWPLLDEKLTAFPKMMVGKFAAAAETGGTALLNIANNGQSSSILAFGTHASHYPAIQYEQQVPAQLVAIDDWIKSKGIDRESLNFVNLDIQGYEINALAGMREQLRLCDFVYTEVNFEVVYVGCALLSDLDRFLGDFGFVRVAIVDTGAGWGDALYSKKNVIALKFRFRSLLFLQWFWRFSRQSLKLTLKFLGARF